MFDDIFDLGETVIHRVTPKTVRKLVQDEEVTGQDVQDDAVNAVIGGFVSPFDIFDN